MTVVHIKVDPRRTPKGFIGPQDIQITFQIVELFYYACAYVRGYQNLYPIENSIDKSVFIDSVSYNSPLNIWAYFKDIPLSAARAVLDRVLYFESENRRRHAEADRVEQAVISDKLDNFRKANEIRKEFGSGELNFDLVTTQLADLIGDQAARIELHTETKRSGKQS